MQGLADEARCTWEAGYWGGREARTSASTAAGATKPPATKFRLKSLIHRIVDRPDMFNALAHKLKRRQALADRLMGIAGGFARTDLDLGFPYDFLAV
jgi:hypothetical protein